MAIETRRFTRLAFVFLSLNAFIVVIAIVFSFFIIIEKYPNTATAEDPIDHQSDSGNVPGPCSSGPCVSQGKCVNMSPHEYICSCPENYFGRTCEHGNNYQPSFPCEILVADSGFPRRKQNPKWGGGGTPTCFLGGNR